MARTHAAEIAVPSAGQALHNLEKSEEPSHFTPAPASNLVPATSDSTTASNNEVDQARVNITKVELQGNSVFSSAELLPLVKNLAQKGVSLSDMQQAASRITAYYHARGYGLARAYLPAENLAGGVLRILVIEGKLGQVALQNQSAISTDVLARYLNSAVLPNAVVSTQSLERALLLISDMAAPTQANLKAGQAPGTTDMDVYITKKSSWARLSLDNYGSRYIGLYRLGFEFLQPNLLHLGDELSGNFRLSDENLHYGKLAFKIPVGSQGLKAGMIISSTHYELGHSLQALNAHGDAQTVSLFTNYPLMRSPSSNVYMQAKWDWKALQDRIDAVQDAVDKHATKWQIQAYGDTHDHWNGLTRGSLSIARNNLSIDTADDLAFDASTLHTDGTATILQASLEHLHPMTSESSLLLNVEAQSTNRNLDVYDKMILGGATKMRAYPLADALGDDGIYATIEWRQMLTQQVQLGAFYEAASLRINHHPLPNTNNTSHLQDVGLLVHANKQAWEANASLAWRVGGDPAQTASDIYPRVWVDVARYW